MKAIRYIHTKDERQKFLILAVILSLLFHVLLVILININDLFSFDEKDTPQSSPQELTFVFPENKPETPADQPREIVENINENEAVPERSNLLSERNSRARNPRAGEQAGDSPLSSGNVPFSNLSQPNQKESRAFSPPKKFSAAALTGETTRSPREAAGEEEAYETQSRESQGTSQMMNQKKFSVEELGALSLSTYKWEWAPYVNAMKRKLQHVWYAPPAYYQLGLIHGYTLIQFTINRSGDITQMEVLKHVGHESLELSSSEAIRALFPFNPLPDNFPDENLTITAKLMYPDLRSRR